MTCRRMTPEEIARADAAYRQWWLSVLTAGIIPRPESERPVGRFISWLTGQEREAESG